MLKLVCKMGRGSPDGTSTTLHSPLSGIQLQIVEILLDARRGWVLDCHGLEVSVLNLRFQGSHANYPQGLVEWATDWLVWSGGI